MDHDFESPNSNDSPTYEDNPRLSNTEHDFEDITHSEVADNNHDELWREANTASAVHVEPASQLYAHMENRAPSKSEDETEVTESEPHYDSPPRHDSPPPPVHSRRSEERGDIHMDQPPRHNFGDEDDDVKGSDYSVSSVEEDRTASEASEMLKQHMPPQASLGLSEKDWQSIRNIVYWNCPLTSAALLISLLLFEFSLLFFSVISVLAYTGLAIMVISLALKLYTHFVSSGSSTTIHRYIEGDWSLSRERTEQISRDLLNKVNGYALYTRDLFLINNYGESIKFGIFLYVLTYIGAWFNFLTLVILATVFTFSIPKVYDIYKREIDHVIRLARRQFKEKWVVVRGKMEELPVVGQKLKRN